MEGHLTVNLVANLVRVQAVPDGEEGGCGLRDGLVEAVVAVEEVEAVDVLGPGGELLEGFEPVGPGGEAAGLVVPRVGEGFVQRDRLVRVVAVAVLSRAACADVGVGAGNGVEVFEHVDRVCVWVPSLGVSFGGFVCRGEVLTIRCRRSRACS